MVLVRFDAWYPDRFDSVWGENYLTTEFKREASLQGTVAVALVLRGPLHEGGGAGNLQRRKHIFTISKSSQLQ